MTNSKREKQVIRYFHTEERKAELEKTIEEETAIVKKKSDEKKDFNKKIKKTIKAAKLQMEAATRLLKNSMLNDEEREKLREQARNARRDSLLKEEEKRDFNKNINTDLRFHKKRLAVASAEFVTGYFEKEEIVEVMYDYEKELKLFFSIETGEKVGEAKFSRKDNQLFMELAPETEA